MTYVLRRLAHGLVLLIAISILSFVLAEIAPGDFLAGLELDTSISRDTIRLLRDRYALDEPLPVRYLHWVESAIRGEFGFSMAYERSVGPLLLARAGNTLLLASIALLLTWLAAVPMGIWSVHRPRGLVDRLGGWLAAALLATPTIVLGLLFLLLAARLDFLPTGGMKSLDFDELSWSGRIWDRSRHLLLPVAALALGGFPVVYRHTRAAIAEVIGATYVKAARARGVGVFRLLFVHALKAAANPLVSLFGLSVAGLLSGSLLIEVILDWPGMGQLLLKSIRARDVHVVVGAVLLSSCLLVVGNLLADLMLRWLDPRTREAS